MKLEFYPHEWDALYSKCGFTDEELEVIRLRRKGFLYTQIADELGYSVKTIERRVKKIKQKILKFM